MRSMKLTVLCSFALLLGCFGLPTLQLDGVQPGANVAVTQKGLDYVKDVFLPVLLKYLPTVREPYEVGHCGA